MHVSVSNSTPFLSIAKHYGIEYGALLSYVDWIGAGGKHGPDSYWQSRARTILFMHPAREPLQADVLETMRRLGLMPSLMLMVNPDE